MSSTPLRLVLISLFAVLTGLSGCGKERLIDSQCREDSQCADGEICDEFRCLPASAKACSVVIDGNPILQADPYSVSFGGLDEPVVNQPITLHNIGNCTLTIYEANLTKGDASPFKCEFCAGTFPVEIFPGRAVQMAVDFQAKGVGAVNDELKILSDDKEYPEMRIPLSANYLGEPKLVVTPNPIDFGYVAVGREGKVALQLTNQGTGVADITVEKIEVSNPTSMDFSLAMPFEGPVTLKPVTPESRDIITAEVRFTPRTAALHNLELWVTTNKGVVKVPMTGNAETPPKVQICATDPAGTACKPQQASDAGADHPFQISIGNVALGTTKLFPVTIVNKGGAPLTVSWAWTGMGPQNTDFSTIPSQIQPIPAGGFTEIQVGYTATSTTGSMVNATLAFTTNDPSTASIALPVYATGVPGAGPEVVKIEMTYDNGSDGTFDNDVRNVDMTLEHPFGYVCNKQNPNPTNWGNYGKPSWLAFAPKEEPERIVLADAMQDGTYKVQVSYMEDCKSVPTGLLAGLLGITTSALLGYFSGGAIGVDPTQVSNLISQLCVSHGGTTANVTVYVNGQVRLEKSVSLGRKGDSRYAVDLIRTGGVFTAQ